MAIDFSTASKALPFVAAARHPILWRGRHGIGKSEAIKAFAAAIGLPVVERRAAQLQEGDLLGLPTSNMIEINGVEAAQLRPFAWLIQACTQPVVLFLDEVDRGTSEVRQGIFQLCDSRKVGDWTLHADTIIVAAVNGGESASEYQVGEMDPAELDRYTTFDVAPSVDDWLSWAGGENRADAVLSAFKAIRSAVDARAADRSGAPIDGLIVDFIRQNPSHLEHRDTFEPNKVYPSRRSWKRFNDTLVAGRLLEDAKANRGVISCLATAYVGLEASVAFADFAANYERQVTAEDIIDHGKLDKIADFGVVEHTALVGKMKDSGIFKNALTPVQLTNLANYLVRLPSEVAMVLFAFIPTAGPNGASNLGSLYKTKATNGKTVREYITSIV